MPSPRTPKRRKSKLDLRLFVAGSGPRSLRSIDQVKRACEKHAAGRYNLSIVDIYTQPEEATKSQIIAVPTLVRQFPHPVRMFIGEPGSRLDGLNGIPRLLEAY